MRRAFVLLLLSACGRQAPVDDLSWRGKPDVLADFSNRNNYPISTRQPAIRGKVLVLDMTGTPVFADHYNNRLPRELRPRSKEEVGTIVWIREIRTPVARYSGGVTGYQETAEITVVDNVDKQAIYTHVLQGALPEDKVKVRKIEEREVQDHGISGGYVGEGVIRYLLQLPRR